MQTFANETKTGRIVSQQKIASKSSDPTVLSDVYDLPVNMAIWDRQIDQPLLSSVEQLFQQTSVLKVEEALSPDNAKDYLQKKLGDFEGSEALIDDMAELVDMFCCLFDVKRAGLRMTMLDRAMCPRFHVDRVPCRLVTTYTGVATEWLPHVLVDRSKLGHGNNGLPDHESGIYKDESDINRLQPGSVALLKGELWEGNEGAGLVHRSPQVEEGERRLLLTLDYVG